MADGTRHQTLVDLTKQMEELHTQATEQRRTTSELRDELGGKLSSLETLLNTLLSQTAINNSTHNFIDLAVAKELGCYLEHVKPMSVAAANGNNMLSSFRCRDFCWRLQGYEFKTEVRTLPLDCCDLVLGVQWLTTLGPIWWDFSNLRMEFSVQGIKHVLCGATKSGCKVLFLNVREVDDTGDNVDTDPEAMLSHISATPSDSPPDLQQLLDDYADLFTPPSELPPFRDGFDHQIPLKSDPSLHKIITELATDPSSHPSYSYANSELRYKNKLVVGNDPAIKLKIFQWLHDSSLGGHSGRDATLHRIKSLFFWPRMTVDVQTYSTPYEIIYGQPPPLHLPYLPGESSSAVVDRSLRKREELLDMLKYERKI
ncbi:hypothetical protein V2J09_022633 [Rumex salicifolius]